MKQTMHSLLKISFATLVLAVVSLNSIAQPTPAKPSPGPSPGPGGIGGPVPMGMPMPQSVLTAEESRAYIAFQQQINEDPAIKAINAKIEKLSKEIQQLRSEASATRERLVSSNPEIKKIQDKLTSAMQTRAPAGAPPMPTPVPNKTK